MARSLRNFIFSVFAVLVLVVLLVQSVHVVLQFYRTTSETPHISQKVADAPAGRGASLSQIDHSLDVARSNYGAAAARCVAQKSMAKLDANNGNALSEDDLSTIYQQCSSAGPASAKDQRVELERAQAMINFQDALGDSIRRKAFR